MVIRNYYATPMENYWIPATIGFLGTYFLRKEFNDENSKINKTLISNIKFYGFVALFLFGAWSNIFRGVFDPMTMRLNSLIAGASIGNNIRNP